MTCESCGDKPKKCNKDFTKTVVEINNPGQITLMRKVTIPASMGDDTTVPPVVGKYKNVLLYYEANQKSYLYSSDGIPTQLVNGMTDYEAATNLPQINGHTLIGDKTGDQLGLQNKLTAGANISIDSDNVISAVDTTYGPATDTEIGLVKPGDGLEVDANGAMSISDIEQYAHFFDTVADMKSATNLINGNYAKTLGFTTKGDEGGATYKIRELGAGETVNNIDLISLHNNIVAELITGPVMTTRQFGSGTNTDVDVLSKALTVCDEIILSDDFIIDPQQINISSNKVVDFNGHKITMGNNDSISWANLIRVSGGHVTLKNGEIDGNSEGQTVAVVTNNTGVLVTAGACTIDNMKIHNCLYEAIITNGKCNLTVTNSSIYDCGRNGVALLSWENVVFENDTFWGVVSGENICDIDIEPYDANCNMGRVTVRNCLFKDNLKKHNFQSYLNGVQTMPAEILMENCKCFGQIAVGYDQGRMSTYTFKNISISGVDDKPALYLYGSKQNVTADIVFIDCAYPIKIENRYTWDYIGVVNINAIVKGTAPTIGVEIANPEGAMSYTHPLDKINLTISGTNSIRGWKLLHNSTIKTNPLIEGGADVTLNENTFYSDIYMTGWAHYLDIDAYHNNSDHVNPPFSIYTNNNNTIRCTKLPALTNMGNGGITMLNNCNLGITLHNHKANNFIVDNVIGIYTARTIS